MYSYNSISINSNSIPNMNYVLTQIYDISNKIHSMENCKKRTQCV